MGVVGQEGIGAVSAIDGLRRINERRQPAHVDSRAEAGSRAGAHGADGSPKAAEQPIETGNLGASEHQAAVVAGEPLGQSQLARHVGVLEVEGLERRGPDALDVPGVEELSETVPSKPRPAWPSDSCELRMVLLRCSMPSPDAQGR